MEFRIEVTPAQNSWTVRIVDPDSGEPLFPQLQRTIRASVPRGLFPLPPEQDVDRMQVTLRNEEDLQDSWTSIVNGNGGSKAESFGRYLFATLMGPDLWQAIDGLAGDGPVDLLLAWEPSPANTVLQALPWEMMHSDRLFLAEMPQVSISREVTGLTERSLSLSSPPRVLFVVGTGIGMDVIRPGAEYLGLLRGLRVKGLSLKPHLLLNASTATIAAAVEWFRPTIVHFICHGSNQNGGSLQLIDPADGKRTVLVSAAGLIAALRTMQNLPLPEIVVMNACDTANASLNQNRDATVPLALELMRRGIPVVVGMAGRVADKACRLFTRGFYEAVLEGSSLASAAARGRLTGFRDGTDPRQSVSWAFPVLFFNQGVLGGQMKITRDLAEQAWQEVANEYAPPIFPAFCDRFDLLESLSFLLAPGVTQKLISGRDHDVQVMGIGSAQADSAVSDRQFGRSWLLKEMAAEAVRDGHLPILVNQAAAPKGVWPKNQKEFLDLLRRCSTITAKRFQISTPDWTWIDTLQAMKPQDPLVPGAPKDIRDVYVGDPGDPVVLGAALRLVLLGMLAAARTESDEAQPPVIRSRSQLERQRMRLLLLIDDVHRLGEATSLVISGILGPLGIREAKQDVRVVFTYASPTEEQKTAAKAIEDFYAESRWAKEMRLGRFPPANEEQLAYEYFLLRFHDRNQPKPLCFRTDANSEMLQAFFESMSREIQGMPPLLTEHGPLLVRTFLNMKQTIFRLANDDDDLKHVEKLKRRP